MSIKGLLFDFNGTLFFDSKYHLDAFNIFFDKYGLERRDREYVIRNIFGRSNRAIFLEQFCPDATDSEIEAFESFKEHLYMDSCLKNPQDLKLCDGAEDMLDYLKEHSVPYCIATGSPLENVKFYFEHLGLDRWFTYDNIVYTDGTFKGKPEPDCYILAAERLGIKAEECLIFEDGTSGIMSADAANAAGVVAIYDKDLPSPLCDGIWVDLVVHSFKDWKEILSHYKIWR